jgi:hypothetical protein
LSRFYRAENRALRPDEKLYLLLAAGDAMDFYIDSMSLSFYLQVKSKKKTFRFIPPLFI